MQGTARPHDVAQHAVEAIAHHRARFKSLDVHVGGAFVHRLRQERVQHADDRRVVARFEQVLDFRQLLQQARELRFALHLVHDVRRRVRRLGIGGLQRRIELALRDELRLKVAAERASQLADRGGRRGVGHPEDELAFALGRRQHRVRLGEGVRNHHCGAGAEAGGATGGCISGSTGLGAGTVVCSSRRMFS